MLRKLLDNLVVIKMQINLGKEITKVNSTPASVRFFNEFGNMDFANTRFIGFNGYCFNRYFRFLFSYHLLAT